MYEVTIKLNIFLYYLKHGSVVMKQTSDFATFFGDSFQCVFRSFFFVCDCYAKQNTSVCTKLNLYKEVNLSAVRAFKGQTVLVNVAPSYD